MGDMSREPSMEEILSSIRRVIARDDAKREESVRERFGTETRTHDPIVTHAVENEFRPPWADADDTLELTDTTLAEEYAVPTIEASAAPQPPAGLDPALVSPDSLAATRQSLDHLSALLTAGETNQPAAPGGGGLTVEALAEAALRPMLKQWLDANLPALVERMVAREIARITGGGR